MSSPAVNDLNRILLGSAIGAAIGLVLLALGVAILWNAADQRLADKPPEAERAPAPVAPGKPDQPSDATASPAPYPTVAPPLSTSSVPVLAEPPSPAARSIWRSIFDDEADAPSEASPAPAAVPRAAPPAPRPAPRPTTPRRPPEAQRQDDSLFF